MDDIISLAEAAELLGRSHNTLRNQAKNGRLHARKIGDTWVTTRSEVERYRAVSLGRPGRPRNPRPGEPAVDAAQPRPGE